MSDTATTSGAGAGVPQERQFHCANCNVSYPSSEEQRRHMRSDWHVYNLKRRIASLPSISAQVYVDQVLVNDAIAEANSEEALSCALCQKTYQTNKQLKGHLKSQKHAQELRRHEETKTTVSEIAVPESVVESDRPGSPDSSESELEFDPSICLFCNDEFDSVDDNMSHMTKSHSLFIPDQESLIDLESLLSYLFILVAEFHECLYCGTIRNSSEGIQHHMVSKGHCTVNLDERSRLEEFYEFPEDKVLSKPGEGLQGDDLRLSSGKTVGHRSKAHLYKQRLPTRHSAPDNGQELLEESTEQSQESTEVARTSRSKAVATRSGDTQGMIGISDVQKRSLQVVERKMMKLEMRTKQEYQRKVEKLGNQQKHFKVRMDPHMLNANTL